MYNVTLKHSDSNETTEFEVLASYLHDGCENSVVLVKYPNTSEVRQLYVSYTNVGGEAPDERVYHTCDIYLNETQDEVQSFDTYLRANDLTNCLNTLSGGRYHG